MQGDVFRRVKLAKQSLKDVEEYIEDGKIGRYVVTRWNSRFVAIQDALAKDLGNNHCRNRWEQLAKIFKPLAEQQMVLQRDNMTLIDFIRGFLGIRTSWKHVTFPVHTKRILLKIWKDRWAMFLDSTYGSAIKCVKYLISDYKDEEEMFSLPNQDEIIVFEDWCLKRIKPNMKDDLNSELARLRQCRNLGIPICKGTCPILETCAALLVHVAVSEAAVERAFSRHRLIHTRLRSQLSPSRLDDSLFVCYNFKRILKHSSQVSEKCLAIEPDEFTDVDLISDIEYEDNSTITDTDGLLDEELEIESD